jgi:hypothetical protein
MLEYLRQLAAKWMGRSGPLSDFPFDPDAPVRVPRSRPSGGGRSSAVAVDEPPPSQVVRAVGHDANASRRNQDV